MEVKILKSVSPIFLRKVMDEGKHGRWAIRSGTVVSWLYIDLRGKILN